jgi:eukaryotic-like serine/threonine-protein kinase
MDINKPAKYLTGMTLSEGWVVKNNITKSFTEGAKSFSESYLVEKNGQHAVLKALDLSIALLDKEPTKSLVQLSKTYDFERELLELCQSKRLDRIITLIAKGTVPPFAGSIIPVPYVILEFAKQDIKSQIDFDSRLNTAWLLRILHNVSVGLWQLHGQGIAHTDLRPEHIVQFSKKIQKITELGMSDKKGFETPNKEFLSSGDPAYLTPEFLYGHTENDWVYKSQGADIFHLGNLIFFLFTQSTFNTWLYFFLDDLNPKYRPGKWGGTFNDVLPYLIDAYDKAVYFFTAYVEDDEVKEKLEVTLRQLCHPDPKRRGHPKNINNIGNPMSVERYISQFDYLASFAELNLSKK